MAGDLFEIDRWLFSSGKPQRQLSACFINQRLTTIADQPSSNPCCAPSPRGVGDSKAALEPFHCRHHGQILGLALPLVSLKRCRRGDSQAAGLPSDELLGQYPDV